MQFKYWCNRPPVITTPVWEPGQFTEAENYIRGQLAGNQFLNSVGISQDGDNLRVEFHLEGGGYDWEAVVEPGQEFVVEGSYFPLVRVVTPQDKAGWFPATEAPGAVTPS